MLTNGIILGFKVLLFVYLLNVTEENFSNKSTNEEFCYFSSLSQVATMCFCKFKCWTESNAHLPLKDEALRQSLVSLNVQLSGKSCQNRIGAVHLANMTNLSTFSIIGAMKTLDLTFLIAEAPSLKKLTISYPGLGVLLMDNLKENRVTSLYVQGSFDPKQWQFVKCSRKTLTSIYLNLNRTLRIPEKLFFQMPEIQFIELNIMTDKFVSSSFSDLPKLVDLSIENTYFVRPIKLQKHTFSNLPALRTMHLNSFDVESNDGDEDFCWRLSENIESFILEYSTFNFVERCKDIWRCVECGVAGSNTFQVIQFKNLLANLKLTNVTLDNLLPNSPDMYLLNTTKLLFLETFFSNVTNSSLARFPLMTHYHHHRRWTPYERKRPFASFGDIDRFYDNPFQTLLGKDTKLKEVKISISNCDCQAFEVYKSLISHNVSVYFFCRNIAYKYELPKTDSWIDKEFYESLMRLKCSAGVLSTDLGFLSWICLSFLVLIHFY